jgi:hypothetical protein
MGDIAAVTERGLFTGNRGIIHDPRTRTLLNRRWTNPAWLICSLRWRDVRRDVMGTGSWTELFFLDEATALAAGHRPCFLCRRPEARAFQACFPGGTAVRAGDIDRVLHAERLDRGQKRLHDLACAAAALPDGAMILQNCAPHLMLNGCARPWSWRGYGAPVVALDTARLITPPSTVAVLRAGYRARLHPTVNGE